MKRLARATPSLSGFVLLLAVEGRTPGLTHNNVWFPREYDREFDAIFRRDIPLLQGTILVLAMFFVVVNLAVEILQAMLDPRMVRN